jgi:hypothetical protein
MGLHGLLLGHLYTHCYSKLRVKRAPCHHAMTRPKAEGSADMEDTYNSDVPPKRWLT